MLRGHYYQDFEKPTPIQPGKTTTFAVDLHTQSYMFRKGHRVMIQVQSSWFPIIDRNPQTFVPNIFEARDSDFQKTEERIYRTPGSASHIVLPVVSGVVP